MPLTPTNLYPLATFSTDVPLCNNGFFVLPTKTYPCQYDTCCCHVVFTELMRQLPSSPLFHRYPNAEPVLVVIHVPTVITTEYYTYTLSIIDNSDQSKP